MEIHCAVCGQVFVPKDREQRLCSWSCRGKWAAMARPLRTPIERACSRCGRSVLSKGRGLVHCDDCLHPQRTCVVCGTEFRQRSPRAAGAVCSLACRGTLGAAALGHGAAHPNYRGVDRLYHTHAWHLRRDEVRERDGWRCIDCARPRSKTVRLHAHHLVSRADWGDRSGHPDDATNLVTLCTGCHKKRHPTTSAARSVGQRKRRRAATPV